jgi:hypothetical protein
MKSLLVLTLFFLSCNEKTNKLLRPPPPSNNSNLTAYFSHDVVSVCINGHTTIKHIPIIYGLFRSTDSLKILQEKNIYFFAGCVDTGENYIIKCTTCNLEYSTSDSIWFDYLEDENYEIAKDSVNRL